MQGIEVYDESGVLVLSNRDLITRILGKVTISKTSGNITGSVTHSALSQGTPFYYSKGGRGNRVSTRLSNGMYRGFTGSGDSIYPDFLVPSWRVAGSFSGNTFNYTAKRVHSTYLVPYEDMEIFFGVF